MAQKLTDLEVDRVDVVGKGANNRVFMVKKAAEDEESIQEEAPEAPDELSWEDEDVCKSAEGGLKAWARNIIRKVAGLPGPERGDTDMGMTADEVKQAMREAVDEGLAPFDERLSGPHPSTPVLPHGSLAPPPAARVFRGRRLGSANHPLHTPDHDRPCDLVVPCPFEWILRRRDPRDDTQWNHDRNEREDDVSDEDPADA